MLEERRVGLISQDEMIKELRADKEQQLRETAHLKAEREELTSKLGRLTAQVSAIDEENRRLTQLLTELRGRRGPNGEEDHAAAAHTAAVTAELKTLRIALKTVESDRDHYRQLSERSEREVDDLRERVAKLEVEVREAHDDRDRAQAGKSVSDDAITRAELARHKAAEEAVNAERARDEAERLHRELAARAGQVAPARGRAGGGHPVAGRGAGRGAHGGEPPARAQDERGGRDHRGARGRGADSAGRDQRGREADRHALGGASQRDRGRAARPPRWSRASTINTAQMKDRAIEVHDGDQRRAQRAPQQRDDIAR